jgi:hypothetical protein
MIFVLTRFLDANRYPLRSKTLWHAPGVLAKAAGAVIAVIFYAVILYNVTCLLTLARE